MINNKKTLLVNEGLSDNVGDQALCSGMYRALIDIGLEVEKADFSLRSKLDAYQDSVVKNKRFMSFKKLRENLFFITPGLIYSLYYVLKRYKNLIEIFEKQFDFLIIGGGQLVLSNRRFVFLLLCWFLIGKIKKSKIFLISVGIGEKFTWLEKNILKYVLKRVDGLYVRDSMSAENCHKNFKIKPSYCPDSAFYLFNFESSFSLSPTFKERKEAIVAPVDYLVFLRYREELKRSGIVFDFSCVEDYYQYWVFIINEQLKKGRVVRLCGTTYDDSKLAAILKDNFFKDNVDVVLLGYVGSFESYLSAALDAAVIISGRMHALILGMVAGAKVSPFYVSKKIIGFFDEYHDKCVPSLKKEIHEVLRDIYDKGA